MLLIDRVGKVGVRTTASQRCGDTKYATEGETLRTHGVPMAEFTRGFVCPLCYGSIRGERIDVPVFAIGTEVFEVGKDGESCKLIGTVQRVQASG